MAQQRSGPPPILFILIFVLIGGAGYWWFFARDRPSASPTASSPASPTAETIPAPPQNAAFEVPDTVPAGSTIRVAGSTTMVTINQNLKQAFEARYPNTIVATTAAGSSKGIAAVLAGTADVAASSRPLTPEEEAKNLKAIPVARDRIAVAIGVNNPFTGNLSPQQVKDIFQGKITNWSDVGGPDATIEVINRPPESGTQSAFQEMALDGEDFGTTPNISTLDRDATTPLLRRLGTNGIGYATYAQIANQQTVRPVAIDGTFPDSPEYPYQRPLFYVYQEPPGQLAKAFIAYATSRDGQQAIAGQ